MKKYILFAVIYLINATLLISCSTYGNTANDLAVSQSIWHAKTVDKCRSVSNKLTRSLKPNMTIQEAKQVATEIDNEHYNEPRVSKSEISDGKKIDILEYWCYQVSVVLKFEESKLVETDEYPLRTLYGYIED